MKPSLGRFGEAWAAAHLSRQGYDILERNVRFRRGEIDIVARDGPELVFVEVKCRRHPEGTRRFGAPEESITRARYARLAAAIEEYLQARGLQPRSYRVDVVAITVGANGRVDRCTIIRGAEPPVG